MSTRVVDGAGDGRGALRHALITTIVAATAAGTAIAIDPKQTRVIVQIGLAVVGIIAISTATGALRRATPLAPPSPFDRSWKPTPPVAPPDARDLVRITRRLTAAGASEADARRNLAPLVSTIAVDRLRHGPQARIDRDTVFEHLPRPVARPLAVLLDPALADTDTRAQPGFDADDTAALVQALEQL